MSRAHKKKALHIIKTHFSYSSEEFYQAYQDSYAYSITAITAGLAASDKKLLSLVKKVLYTKVTREFAEPIERKYFLAFAKNRGVQAFLEMAQSLKYLRQAQETWASRSQVLIDFPAWQNFVTQKLEHLLEGIGKIHGKLDDVHDDVKMTQSAIEEIRELLSELLQRQNLSTQLKPRDEFTQHNNHSLNLIQKAASQFQRLSKNDTNYTQVSMMLGSALSSTGELKKAERLFNQVLETSSVKAERAMAHFNLFQVQLRTNNYAATVKNLQQAINLNPQSYTLHDNEKYPLESLLGAGGMGCVFRCNNRNRLIKQKKVVVKCFWENLSGSIDEVFKEPFAMRDIAGDYIPEPLDFGYVDYFAKNRAYFVFEASQYFVKTNR